MLFHEIFSSTLQEILITLSNSNVESSTIINYTCCVKGLFRTLNITQGKKNES